MRQFFFFYFISSYNFFFMDPLISLKYSRSKLAIVWRKMTDLQFVYSVYKDRWLIIDEENVSLYSFRCFWKNSAAPNLGWLTRPLFQSSSLMMVRINLQTNLQQYHVLCILIILNSPVDSFVIFLNILQDLLWLKKKYLRTT